MIRYWQNRIDKKVQECSTPDFNSEALNLSFRNFERERLSPREQDVVALLLRGHSSLSAAKNLGIAEGTVKIHRKNIYAKLGISSQSMLFSRFITSIIKH
nr:helix-turn-helix transcriptional regulator [Acetobacter estunensis]